MFDTLELTRMAQGLAAHAGSRMGFIAQNLAHADTPGYRSRDIPSFAETLSAPGSDMRFSRPRHLTSGDRSYPSTVTRDGAEAPNGNSVSIEGEMVKAAEARQQHDMALAIYRSTSGVIRAALGRS